MSAPFAPLSWATAFEPYGKGLKAPLGALLDQDLLARLRRYKRQVAKRYRVVEPELVPRLLPDEPMFVSPKLDGELWFLVNVPGSGHALVAYNGRVLTGVTTLDGVEARLASAPQLVIAGELFAPPSTGERARNHHTGAALSEPKLEPTLKFRAFDLVEEGGEDALVRSYESRHASLLRYLGEELVVPTERGNAALVAQRYREWAAPGTSTQRYEGIVARSDRGLTYKIKPTITVDLIVVAYGERITGELSQVRELEVALMRDDGTLQLVGSVGTGMSEDDRSRWHDRLTAMEARSSFRLANREGTLCRFVKPEIVVEVRVSDFLSTDAWDAPIRRMSLSYDRDGGYAPLSELRTAVLIHPTLLRERTDKKADATDAGMTQITSYLEDAVETRAPTQAPHRASDVVQRRVWTKETKGQLAVRKLVVIKTNKEHEGTHPPFVVHFTDYSAGRKAPLETAIRTASTREGADRAVAAWIEENVKKGWTEPGAAAEPKTETKSSEDPAPAKRSRAKKPKPEAE
jgi:hypothetical protein